MTVIATGTPSTTDAALWDTACVLVAPGHGILAIDESVVTISKRFAALGIESTAESRRAYREALLMCPGIGDCISGAILYDETVRQTTSDGVAFPDAMHNAGIICGIKVDIGAKPLAGCPDETVTEGLDGLRERIAEYAELGARFAEWRAVIQVDDRLPSRTALAVNAHALARYAALCQEGGLVPTSISGARRATRRAGRNGPQAQHGRRWKQCCQQPSVDEVAESTLRCLRRSVPTAVGGIAFLSGGQSATLATEHLNAINAQGPHPWRLTFSYGRALQDPCLAAWRGDPGNVMAAQASLLRRAACNAAASLGNYGTAMEA